MGFRLLYLLEINHFVIWKNVSSRIPSLGDTHDTGLASPPSIARRRDPKEILTTSKSHENDCVVHQNAISVRGFRRNTSPMFFL